MAFGNLSHQTLTFHLLEVNINMWLGPHVSCDWDYFCKQRLTFISTYFYKMTTTVPQLFHTNRVTFFLWRFKQTTVGRFRWLNCRHRGSVHESIDGEIVGNMNLRVLSFPTVSACDTVRIRSGCLSHSNPDSLQPHGALWIVQFHFTAGVFLCTEDHVAQSLQTEST